MRILCLSILSLVLLSSCSFHDSDDLPDFIDDRTNLVQLDENYANGKSIELVKDLVFSDSLMLDNIPVITIDEVGNLYMAGEAWNRNDVYLFDSDGKRIETFTNSHSDDITFSEIANLQIVNDHLLVFDGIYNRVHHLNTVNGSLAKSQELDPSILGDYDSPDQFDIKPLRMFEDGSLLIQINDIRNPSYFPHREIRYYKVDSDLSDEAQFMFSQKGANYLIGDYAGRPAPFLLSKPERSILAFDEYDNVYDAWSENFYIRVLNRQGLVEKSFYMPFERAELNRDRVIHPMFSHNDQILRVRESAVYPEKWPALYSVVTDDNHRIWISTVTDDEEKLQWYIIRNDDIYAIFRWPFDKPIFEINNGFVYTVESNQNGFKEVVRYEINELQL